ncbi:MAG: hypothetical protein DMG13_20715 [Acidobacteria bacterium]|nr:MAG: hypothetical protein DMG13_20715 [Acidobacteriota bacterium]
MERPEFPTQLARARLVSIQELPNSGEMCEWESSSERSSITALEETHLFDALQERSVYAATPQSGTTVDVTRQPVRTIRDAYPIYSSVAVDPVFGEVILQDNNLWATAVFNRLDNTPPNGPPTEPQRLIKGLNTDIQFNNGLYVDPKIGEIYSIESDTGDKIVIFSHDATGNVAPARFLHTPHRGYGIAVDEDRQELFVTVEYPPKVMVYRKGASGEEKPLRFLEGEHTQLQAIHGIAVDAKNKLLFVNNWGNESNFRVPGTGKFHPPSITVYPLGASGDTPPVRVIQGPKTQMNWPAAMALNPDNGDLYVANDVGHSILVFKATDQGDVAPARVIKGKKTGLVNPTGVSLDTKNKEFWVANLGNSTATAYPLMANGEVAPVRIIRSAPVGYRSTKFGKTEAVAYDSKREEYLVPN